MKMSSKILPIIILFTAVSCDLFQVRDPEDPNETKSSYRVPVEPKGVIENLINSFKDRNSNDYKMNFSTGPPLVNRDFYFVPSGNVFSNFPTNWNINEEFQYFNNLITRTPQNVPITLLFSDEEYDIRADSSIYSAKYFLSVPILNSEPKIFRGSLKFTMITDITAAWIIYFWEDIAEQDSKSWSELKIEFYL